MKQSLRKIALATVGIGLTMSAYGASEKIAHNNDVATKFLVQSAKEWKSAPAMQRTGETPKMKTRSITLGPSQEYSFIAGPNGEEWIALQNLTESATDRYYYTKSDIQLYNSDGEKTGEFTVEVPEGMAVNQIMIGNAVTNRFFDTKSSTEELPVSLHVVHSPGVISFVTYIYDIATGEKKETVYDGYVALVPYSTGYSTDYVAVVSRKGTDSNNQSVTCYDVYQKATYSAPDAATLKHTFEIPTVLAEYQTGNPLNVFELDNTIYYTLSQYEKEYMSPESYEPPYDMIPTSDNNYKITTFDKNFKEVNSIKIPVPVESGLITQFGVGMFGVEEFTNGFWSGDDKKNIVVSRSTLNISSDSESHAFDVYDSEGSNVLTIAEGVGDWLSMYDIPGMSKQMAFLAADGATLSMVDIPSCEPIISFGHAIGGYAISTNIDRYPAGDTYQYVVGLPEAQLQNDKSYNVGYAWINARGEIDHIDWLNVGAGFQNWTPLVIGDVLNPYLFDTDAKREYMFILNQRVNNSSALLDEIRVVKADGTAVKTFQEDATGVGDLGYCSIIGFDTNYPKLFMPFYNSSTNEMTIQMEELPFAMYSGGDGSVESPYQIASAGDMAMIARDTAAHYEIVNDIDMKEYGAWSPISTFTGTLDGKGHKISNLYVIDHNGGAGLFAMAEEGAIIKNLTIESATVEVSDNAFEVGVLVGNATTTIISNIHVIGATIEADEAYATIGGIAGCAYFNTTITDCLVKDIEIAAPMSSNVGGIAGSTGTAVLITSCATSGSINAGNTIGGITGASGSDCAINDCHVNMTISGENTIGGVVGSDSRGGIYHCYVEGSLTATSADSWSGHQLGGIVGNLAPTFEETAKIISNNVVALSSLNAEGDDVKSCHRVVGYSRYDSDMNDAQWDPTIVPEAEAGLENNYVVETLDIVDSNIANDHATTEGQTVAESELGKAFYEGLGFKYGTESTNPWATNTATSIYLYFEDPNYAGVEELVVDQNKGIVVVGKEIEAAGAVAIEAYNVSGVKVGVNNSESLSTSNLTSGIYVVVATYADGSKSTAKVIVK